MKQLTSLPRMKNGLIILGASVVGFSLMLPAAGFAMCSSAGHQATVSSTINGRQYAEENDENTYNNRDADHDWGLTPREQERARREELRHEHHEDQENEGLRNHEENHENWRNHENHENAQTRHEMHERHEQNESNHPNQGESD